MDRGLRRPMVRRITKSRTRLKQLSTQRLTLCREGRAETGLKGSGVILRKVMRKSGTLGGSQL